MVVFVDLEDESEPPERVPHWSLLHQHGVGNLPALKSLSLEIEGRINPNKNALTEALGCYPYVSFFLMWHMKSLNWILADLVLESSLQ